MEKTSGSQSPDTSSKPVSEQEFRKHILGLTFFKMGRGKFGTNVVEELNTVQSIHDRLTVEQKKLLTELLHLTSDHRQRGIFDVPGADKLNIVHSIYDRLNEKQKTLLAQSAKNSRTMTP